MKLTFQLGISANDLAKALATGKTAVQVSGLLAVEPSDCDNEQGSKVDDMKMDNVEVDGDLKAKNNKAAYTDHHIVEMGVSKLEGLPYQLLQVQLKARGSNAAGKHGVLASRLYTVAQMALKKTSGSEAVVDSQRKKSPGNELVGKDLLPKVVVQKQEKTQNNRSKKATADVRFDDSSDSSIGNENYAKNTGSEKAATKKPIICFDDDSVDEDYALSQDVARIYALRDSLDNTSIGN